MRFSLELPTQRVDQPEQFVTAEAIVEVTRTAAAAGFAAVNVTDHPAPDARWLDQGGHHALDPFVALGIAATADERIFLHTNIYVAAYRNPFLGAKQVHTLQVLTDGRLVLGVAAGYLKPEFAALGVDFSRRGALLDQALEVLDEVCAGDDVAREGEGFSARGVRFRPVPPGGRPTIWVGGNSRAAMARAARYDGWAPFHTAGFATASRTDPLEDLDALRAASAAVRSAADETAPGRPFDVCWSESRTPDAGSSSDERCTRLTALAEAGVTWATTSLPGGNRDELIAAIATFGREVIAELGSPGEHL
ncbi:MAG TPA: TIGR03619 family F420-dependent LLM class oxidoreductase [Acidimicrobiales bacterium]|nr:TIGR03619 family F420-dependent LLM class oxidoreductase [Acidimicrobiales bacterium]